VTELKAAVVGLGQMGRKHVRVLRELEGIELVAVADVKGDYDGIAVGLPVVNSAEDLLDYDIDLCVIATPTDNHFESGLVMAEAGVNTLIEKPIASNLKLSDELISAFASSGVTACVGHIERFNPAIRAMRERLLKGQLGRIFQISTRRQGPFVERVRDVGVVKDLGTHDLDLAMWLIDESIISVAANTAYRMGREDEDLASISTMFENGIIGNHLVNWVNPFKERVVQVVGEKGCLVADTVTADLTFWANEGLVSGDWDVLIHSRGVSEGDVVRYAIKKPEPLQVELEAFRDAVLGIQNDTVSLEEGRSVLKVAEACLDSAKINSAITIEKKV
jgi:UDP-N-acetylglucosamine 3-dehydrogenase